MSVIIRVSVCIVMLAIFYSVLYLYLWQRRRQMFLPMFVCLSVCLLARLLKNACMDLDEMLRVDWCWDVDELINFWALTDPDYSPDVETVLLSPRNFIWRLAAAARHGFKMVLFTAPSKHLCRRYMRSTECPSSSFIHPSLCLWLTISGMYLNLCHRSDVFTYFYI